MSCLNARWITPSDAAAALRRTSRSSSVPRSTSAPAASSGGGGRVRAGQPDDLMAGADELGNDGGADPAGRAGDEDTHERTSKRLTVLGPKAGAKTESTSVTDISIPNVSDCYQL